MTELTNQCYAPPIHGQGARLLARAKAVFHALRQRRALAAKARRKAVIAKDLTRFDSRTLRDIGIDRSAM